MRITKKLKEKQLYWNYGEKFKLLGIINDLQKVDFTEDNLLEKIKSIKNCCMASI